MNFPSFSRILFLIVLLVWQLLKAVLGAANPILPITHEWHTSGYYAEQADQWKVIAENDACNTMAWYHYYQAAHYANLFGHQPAFDVADIHQRAEKVLTEQDFALHYIRIRRTQQTEERWTNLLAAHRADPNRPEAYAGLVVYHLIREEMAQVKSFLQKMDAGLPFPRGVLAWSQNQLNSVEKNGVLLTHGDNDTYGTLLLQNAYDLRADVQVINLALFQNFPNYRTWVCRKIGISVPDGATLASGEQTFDAILATDRPVYLGVGADEHLISAKADQLYLTGLAFRHSETPFNNLGVLVNNYRQHWRLDELDFPLDAGPRRRVVDQLERNYLPAFFELHDHFKATDAREAERIEQNIYRIAQASGLQNVIDDYFRPAPPQLASKDVALKAKSILKNVVFVPNGTYQDYVGDGVATQWPNYKAYQGEPLRTVTINGFYLQTTEVSNADYQLFLEDLLRQRRFPFLDSASIAEFDYRSVLPKDMQSLPVNELYLNPEENLGKHPVTNISKRGAELYAIWLTQVYNQDPKRKDGRKVRFRLPHPDEIAYATLGGRTNVPFSWGGYGINNAKGCYLVNFNTLLDEYPGSESSVTLSDYYSKAYVDRFNAGEEGECGTDDGGYLTVPVDSYFPNELGLYNLIGNAAEMTSEVNIDTGGSWFDHVADLEIGRRKQRALPHPAVGFRLVMEYID